MARDDQRAAVEAYHAKGRVVSTAWSAIEALRDLDVADAALARSDRAVAMRISVSEPSGAFHRLVVRAAAIRVLRSDGEPCSVEALRALGDAYWEAFAARGITR